MHLQRFLIFLMAITGMGCQNGVFRVVDSRTGKPIEGIEVMRLVEHGTVQQLLMGLPAGHEVSEKFVTNPEGIVQFERVRRPDTFLFTDGKKMLGRVDIDSDVEIRRPPKWNAVMLPLTEGQWVVPVSIEDGEK